MPLLRMPRKALVISAVPLAAALAVAVASTLDVPEDQSAAGSPPLAVAPFFPTHRPSTAPKPPPPQGGFTVEQVKKGRNVALHAKPDIVVHALTEHVATYAQAGPGGFVSPAAVNSRSTARSCRGAGGRRWALSTPRLAGCTPTIFDTTPPLSRHACPG